MTAKTKTNYLISEIRSAIKGSFNEWYVGTTNQGDMWRNNKTPMVIFNLIDDEATKAAYEQLVRQGMLGLAPTGREPYYLYLYRVDGGPLPAGFMY